MSSLPGTTSLMARDVARLLTERIPDLNLAAASEIVEALFAPEHGIISTQLQKPDIAEAAVTFRGFGTFQRAARILVDADEGSTVGANIKFSAATALRRHVTRVGA